MQRRYFKVLYLILVLQKFQQLKTVNSRPCNVMSEIELDIIYANEATIFFRSGMYLSSIGTIQVFTPISTTNFHVVNKPISFLLCLKDMDILHIKLNKITSQLICQDGTSIPIFCKWEHLCFFVKKSNQIAASIHFIEAELC